MKIPLRYGLVLLVGLLLGASLLDGPVRTALLVGAMGVALWSALSLPNPGPKPPQDGMIWIEDGEGFEEEQDYAEGAYADEEDGEELEAGEAKEAGTAPEAEPTEKPERK